MTTLIEIAKINLGDDEVGLIDEAFAMSPEISGTHPLTGQVVPNVGDAKTIAGTKYETLIRNSVPTGNSFRDANDGVDKSSSGHALREVSTYTFDKRFEVDRAVADRYEDGAAAYLTMEAGGIMEGGVQDLSKQFYYGTNATAGGQAKGHPGLLQFYDTDNMEIDAAGTADNTGSSVYFVKFGVRDVRFVVGQDGEFAMSDVRIETIKGNNDKSLDGYVQTLLFYPGLQMGHKFSCLRIKNLTEQAGKGLTDALLTKAYTKFANNRKMRPDVAFLTWRSLEQLQQSRTATSPTGDPAPIPTVAA